VPPDERYRNLGGDRLGIEAEPGEPAAHLLGEVGGELLQCRIADAEAVRDGRLALGFHAFGDLGQHGGGQKEVEQLALAGNPPRAALMAGMMVTLPRRVQVFDHAPSSWRSARTAPLAA